jgi:hypothetical protein
MVGRGAIGRRAPPEGMDPVLRPLLEAAGEREWERAAERLLAQRAQPVLRRVLARRHDAPFARSAGIDSDDLRCEIVARIVLRLRELRADPEAVCIRSFSAYVAATAEHVCDAHLRGRHPERSRLKNRVRYLFRHRPGLAMRADPWGQVYCALASWEEAPPSGVSPRTELLRRDPIEALRRATGDPGRLGADLSALAVVLLEWVGRPVPLDDLTHALAGITGLAEPAAQPIAGGNREGGEELWERVRDEQVDVQQEIAERDYLQRLWGELALLPPPQCAALLLNLRDAGGRGVLALLPLRGVARIREIAAALGMEAAAFAALWNDLPLEDQAIAGILGVTRQQVINLRLAARRRLSRRMKQYESE